MSLRLRDRGPLGWMARHPVAPNLIMLLLILGGLFMMTQVRKEVFPSFDLDTVTIVVPLPGATPEEVEQGIVLAIEEEVRGVAGIDKVTSTASEGVGRIVAELANDADRIETLGSIQQAVDNVTTLPEDAEEPVVALDARKREVVELQVYGDVDEGSLREAAELVRNRILQEPGISQVDLTGVRDLEIHVEPREGILRAFGVTLADVARVVSDSALDRSGGTLETAGGDVLLRVADRRDAVQEFENLPIVAERGGTVVRLGDIATVRAGFADGDEVSTFNGVPAIRINIYRVGDETPVAVSEGVRRAVPEALRTLPAEIRIATVDDDSEIYQARMDLLLKNGALGLLLVLLLLTLFLELKLAFWVALGIPTAFIGSMLFLPSVGASVNMVTMFAFIVALGIVVDDAIVAGENIYEYRQRGLSRIDAAIQGARDIAVPLSFSILTNIVAFLPLVMMPGRLGAFFFWIPVVVGIVFLLSWLEALFVLPAHLAGTKGADDGRRPGPLRRVQLGFAAGLSFVVERLYGPLLARAMTWRYFTTTIMFGLMVIMLAWVQTGRTGWGLFPSIPRDNARATVTMPVDAPLSTTLKVRDQMVEAAERVIAENGGDALAVGVYAHVDATTIGIRAYLTPGETRAMSTREFTSLWRAEAGTPAAARSLSFSSSWGGPGGGSGLQVRVSHPDVAVLEKAAADLVRRLNEFPAVTDAEDGFIAGKAQLEFRLTEAGRTVGLTSGEVAGQVRAAFFGVEAIRQQRGRNEVTVRVRLPESLRTSEAAIERMLIRAPGGGYVPLYQVAEVTRGRADSRITREDGLRFVNVTADVVPPDQTNIIVSALISEVIPAVEADFPGLSISLEGRQASTRDIMQSFVYSVFLALAIIYALLAIPFRSWIQPLIVMTAIPFGFVGAVLGHQIMGASLSIPSVMGIIALGGVVINAALVMIDYANKARDAGMTDREAIWLAGKRRFRPILLTTLTTFGGLAPMIFETSRQAQFLIPMAISLGYGIVFATAIVLFLVPCLFLIVVDARTGAAWLWRALMWLAFPTPEGGAPRPPEGSTEPQKVAAE